MEPVEKLQLSDKVFSLLCPDMNDPVGKAPAENQIIIDEMKNVLWNFTMKIAISFRILTK